MIDAATRKFDSLGRPMKHGMARTPEYRAWQHMIDRCCNTKSQRYDRYGARGIKVCERWKANFEAFYGDMGSRPSPLHSLDRIDNDGDYEPGNCRWATRAEQNRNRGDCRIIEWDGLRMTVAEWARHLGIEYRTLLSRFQAGWNTREAFTRPTERRIWNGVPNGDYSPTPWKRNRSRKRDEIQAQVDWENGRPGAEGRPPS